MRYARGCGRGVGRVGIVVCDWGLSDCVGSGSVASAGLGGLAAEGVEVEVASD